MDRPLPTLFIGGPTASGKTNLAVDIATRFGGAVINSDSMQVYRDLRILTARPGPEALKQAPHRLYGVLDGALRCSAGRWLDMARTEIAAAHEQELFPIVVGGTGLYLRSLLRGLAPVPEVPKMVRDAVSLLHAQEGSRALYLRLSKRDPLMAKRLDPTDTLRIVRAYEVIEATGQSLAAWQAKRHHAYAGRSKVLVLVPPRASLYAACNARFSDMVRSGALDEVERLVNRQLDPNMPIMKAVGVAPILDHLSGQVSLEDAIAKGSQATRRYAKRQGTWFRHQVPEAKQIGHAYNPRTKEDFMVLVKEL